MKRLLMSLVALILISCQPAYSAECTTQEQKTLDGLSDQQWNVLYQAYDTGVSHNLGHTMMAIAFGESTAGKYKVNPESQDYGVMQINIKTAKSIHNVTGYYGTRELITKLVVDDQLNMDTGLKVLLYWQKQVKGWRNMVSAYNNGWAYNKGTVFMNKVRTNTRMFMNCVNMESHETQSNNEGWASVLEVAETLPSVRSKYKRVQKGLTKESTRYTKIILPTPFSGHRVHTESIQQTLRKSYRWKQTKQLSV